jgi:hypothetical protein
VVTYAELRSLDPQAWLDAGQQWLDLAVAALRVAEDVHEQVAAPLGSAWPDTVGRYAAAQIDVTSDGVLIASLECRAAGYVCRGLGHVLTVCRHLADSAARSAAASGLAISDDGVVGEDPRQRVPGRADEVQTRIADLQTLVDQAVSSATRADGTAREQLDRLADQTTVTDVVAAENDDLGAASRAEVDMLDGLVPHGAAADNTRWWAALSEEDRRLLMLSSAGTLDTVAGLPDDVRAALRGSDKFDRSATARWAADHWNDTSDDPFDDNCTNFASNSLAGGGLAENSDFWLGTLSDDSWSKGGQTGNSWIDSKDYSHSASWAQAATFYDYMLDHGATDVGTAAARPGDIVMWEGTDGVHHAAVVTSVVDGDIRYTQHTGEQLNASLQGREPLTEDGAATTDGWGAQKIHVLRINPDW